MPTRRPSGPDLSEVTRRRLELLRAEIAQSRGEEVPAHPSDDLPVERAAGPAAATPSRGHPGRHARRSLGPAARLLGWVQDRLPATLQGRVRLGIGQLGVLVATVAAGLALSAWWVLRAEDGTTFVQASSPSSTAPLVEPVGDPPAVAPTTLPSPGGGGSIVVDVAGKVRRPGITTLPVGARVVDAVEAAGGLRRGVDRLSINLARLLVDGEQVVVGVAPPPGVAAGAVSGATPTPGVLLNLNTADQAALEQLPGIGPVTATAILTWREENGGFRAVDELLEVSGIGEVTLTEIAPLVTL